MGCAVGVDEDPDLTLKLLLAVLHDAGGRLQVSREAARWVARLSQAGEQCGYAARGCDDGIALRLVRPEVN